MIWYYNATNGVKPHTHMSEDLVIDLTKLDSTEPLEAENLIFRDNHKAIVKAIERTLVANLGVSENELKNEDSSASEWGKGSFSRHDDKRRFLNIRKNCNFFINGSRGAGKSTIMRAVKRTLVEKKKYLRIHALADVDPSRMAPGENFIIHILSVICERLEDLSKSAPVEDIKKLLSLIQDMSSGLKLLVSSTDSWCKLVNSPSFIEECIDQCTSAADMSKKFCRLMDELCVLMNINAFLITIDDADTRFDKSYDILEYVRIYMNSPRLIFLWGGNMEQCSLVIRAHQLEQFGREALLYDKVVQSKREKLLDSLGEQYLLKLIPAGNVFHLSSARELLRDNSRKVVLNYTHYREDGMGERKKMQLNDLLSVCFRYMAPAQQRAVLRDFFATLSIRSVLQMLHCWCEIEAQVPVTTNKDAMAFFPGVAEGIMSVALYTLQQNEIDCVSIRKGDFVALLQSLVSHVLQCGNIEEASKLLPNVGNQTRRLISFYLTSEVVCKFLILKRKLVYLCFVMPQLEMLSAYEQKQKRNQTTESIWKEDIKYYGMYYCKRLNNYDSRQASACATTCIFESIKDQNIRLHMGKGLVCLSNARTRRENKCSLATFFKRLSANVEAYIKSEDDALAFIAFCFSLGRVEKDSSQYYCLSIYNLLSALIFVGSMPIGVDVENMMSKENFVNDFQQYVKGIEMCSYFPVADSLLEKHEGKDENINSMIEYILSTPVMDKLLPLAAEKIWEWLEKHEFLSKKWDSSPVEFWNCWQSFMRHCHQVGRLIEQRSAPKKSNDNSLYPFYEYMSAFEISISEYLDGRNDYLSRALAEFPVWKKFKDTGKGDTAFSQMLKCLLLV